MKSCFFFSLACGQLLDEAQVTLSFQDWLASVTKRTSIKPCTISLMVSTGHLTALLLKVREIKVIVYSSTLS